MEEIKFYKTTGRVLLCWVVVFALLGLVSECLSAERALDMDGIYNASCRIYNGGTAGSGAAFHEDEEGNVYIVTNYHVAGTSQKCMLNFFTMGNNQAIPATYVWHAYNQQASLDVTILKVDKGYAHYIKSYIPMWNSDVPVNSERDCFMVTAGAPKALWLREIKGTIRFNGNGNATFCPTPFGGQSGSSIVCFKDGKPYIAAICTWRTTEEGKEDFGGLAQPISRIINAMHGNVAEEDYPIPTNAIECPVEVNEDEKPKQTGGREVILPDGTKAIECSSPVESGYSFEQWSISGCDPCFKARTYLNPQVAQLGFPVSVHHGDGNERIVAEQLGISNYPTFRLVCNGEEVERWVGYNDVQKDIILGYLTNVKCELLENDIKALKDSGADNETQCEDDVCRLFGQSKQGGAQGTNDKQSGSGNTSGRFGLFDIPKTDGNEDGNVNPKNEEQKDSKPFSILPKPEPKVEPKSEPDSNGGLFNWRGKLDDELDKQKDKLYDEFNQKLKGLAMCSFWLMVCACLLALACFDFVCKVFRCLWWGIRKGCSILRDKVVNGITALSENVAQRINEQSSKSKTKTEK